MVPACMFIYPQTDTHAYTYLKIKTTYKENPERNMAFEVLIILQLAYKVMGFFLTFFFLLLAGWDRISPKWCHTSCVSKDDSVVSNFCELRLQAWVTVPGVTLTFHTYITYFVSPPWPFPVLHILTYWLSSSSQIIHSSAFLSHVFHCFLMRSMAFWSLSILLWERYKTMSSFKRCIFSFACLFS